MSYWCCPAIWNNPGWICWPAEGIELHAPQDESPQTLEILAKRTYDRPQRPKADKELLDAR